MATVRRMVNRTIGKKPSKPAASVARRKCGPRTVTPLSDGRLIGSLQRRLIEAVSSSAEEGRSPIGVSAVFVQYFWQLTKVDAIAIYVRDEQTREMTCLAEAGRGDASIAADWRKVLLRAEHQAQVTRGDLHAFRLHRIGRLEGLVILKTGSAQRLSARKLLTALRAIEPWLAVALDHARLSVKYAAKILRIQHMEQVSDVLNSSLAKEEKLRRALDAAIRLVEAEAGALFLKSQDGTLQLYALSGDRTAAVPSLQSPIAATVHRTGHPVLITHGVQDNRVMSQEGWSAVIPVASLVSVPVRTGAQAVGVLEVVNRRSGKPFSNWDVLELASLSNQFGLAIENFRKGAAGEGALKQTG